MSAVRSKVPLRVAALLAVGLLPTATAAAQCLVPTSLLRNGGVGRDGIPALTKPTTVSADAVGPLLDPTDWVLGVVQTGKARAYPLRILW